MEKFGELTVGIISRNGQPFIESCLKSFSSSLSILLHHFNSINFILVDSNSNDNTLDAMIKFAEKVADESVKAHVFLLEGFCNAAIARNVILNNCVGDILFLCDGDIIINHEFIIQACIKITDGEADGVVGQLAEKWYDSEFNFYKSIPVRKKITHAKRVWITGGIMIISMRIVQDNIKFDEIMKRSQDRDFSLRASKKFTILALPAFVGTHLTQPYFSNERFGTFIKENYNKYLGILLRKHVSSPKNLFEIATAEKGVFLGFVYIISLICSLILCLYGVYAPVVFILFLIIIDFILHVKKSLLKRFIMKRFISPIMVLHGFFFPCEKIKHYTITKVH